MSGMYNIDYFTYFADRKLIFKPKHFVTASAPLTDESELWILKNLRGRYAIVVELNEREIDSHLSPAFEDPAEATAYELTWG